MSLLNFKIFFGVIFMTTQTKFIDLRELGSRIDLKKSAIYERLDPKSKHFDPSFPKPLKVGLRGIRFVQSEVEAYAQSLIAKRNSGTLLKAKLTAKKTDDVQKIIRGK
jgi:prophage regulatory protein